MRYVTFSLDTEKLPRLGVVHGDRVVDVQSLSPPTGSGPLPGSMLELIQQGPGGVGAARRDAAQTELPAAMTAAARHDMEKIRWHAPIPRPAKNVFCLGLNYASHARRRRRARGREAKIPEIPVFFTKAPTTVTGPYRRHPLRHGGHRSRWTGRWSSASSSARAAANIPRAEALEHVFGYTVINDVTARDLQKNHLQWFKGKSLDGFCPMGPVVVTADEFGDPQAKARHAARQRRRRSRTRTRRT